MSNATENARKVLKEYDATEYLEAESRDFEYEIVTALRDLLTSIEYEYAQGFETDYYEAWYVGKSFGHESNRAIDEGYTLIKRGLLPWEKA